METEKPGTTGTPSTTTLEQIEPNTWFGGSQAGLLLAMVVGEIGDKRLLRKLSRAYNKFCFAANEINRAHNAGMDGALAETLLRDQYENTTRAYRMHCLQMEAMKALGGTGETSKQLDDEQMDRLHRDSNYIIDVLNSCLLAKYRQKRSFIRTIKAMRLAKEKAFYAKQQAERSKDRPDPTEKPAGAEERAIPSA